MRDFVLSLLFAALILGGAIAYDAWIRFRRRARDDERDAFDRLKDRVRPPG